MFYKGDEVMERNIQLNWKSLVEAAIKRRKSLRFTQQRLATFCGLSTPTISRFENMREDIQLSSILAILKALGMLANEEPAQ
jgi:transcriptional regulator with XRE-family HTH domain